MTLPPSRGFWRSSRSPMKTSRPLPAMPTRRSRTSACCRRFAERDALTFRPTFVAADGGGAPELTSDQRVPYKSTDELFREIAVDALVFEFIGFVMLEL